MMIAFNTALVVLKILSSCFMERFCAIEDELEGKHDVQESRLPLSILQYTFGFLCNLVLTILYFDPP